MLSRAIRSWMIARGTAALAILAFAIGIGAATAMYTVVKSVLLRPLPYAESRRWVTLYGGRTTEPAQFSASTVPDLLEFQRRATSFDVFGIFTSSTKSMTSPGDPRHVTIVSVTPDLGRALGVAPAIGHWFTDSQGAAISDTLWRALGADPKIVGASITLDRVVYTITAVMPPRFALPISAPGTEGVATDVWIGLDPTSPAIAPNVALYFAYARLKPGLSLSAASAEVTGIGANIAARDPLGHQAYVAKLEDLQDVGVREQRPTLLLLLGASALLLVIACANVAGLLLVRSVTRAREIATRIALGASASRLAWQFFLEGALVSIAGAALGIVVSIALVRAVMLLGPEFVPRTSTVEMDATVPLVSLALGLLTAIASTLAPLWQTRHTSPADALEAGVRVSVGARARRVSQALVIAEIATAFALLVAGGALALRLRSLGTTPTGFDPDHVLAFSVDVPEAVASDESRRVAYFRELADAVNSAPGVMTSGFSNQLPLDGCCWSVTIEREGHAPGNTERVSFIIASPSYFTTMRIPLVRGRFLTDEDSSEDPAIVVLNQAAAKRYWGTDDPVGDFGRFGGTPGTRFQVVGVVGDVKNTALGGATVPEIYVASRVAVPNPARFVVRSTLRADALLPGIRRAIRDVDSALPIHDVTTIDDVVKGSLAAERVSAGLSGGFALTALLMATLGIYGVISYAVRQRTVEIGTRMAIGASSGDILRLVVGNGLTLAIVGTVIGTVVVLAASPWLARALDLQTFSWASFFGSAAVVGLVATSATGVPAWRAASMPPHLAVRDEVPATWEIARAEMRRAIAALSRRIPFSRVAGGSSDRALLAGFVDAARSAGSHADAMQQALDMICAQLGASSAVLLERSNGHYTCVATSPSSAQRVTSLQHDGWLSRRLSAYGQALSITAGDLDAALQWSAAHHPAVRDEIAELAAAHVRVAVALRAREDVIGFLLLGSPADGGSDYSRSERAALTASAPQLALMIENGKLTARIVTQEKVRRDLALAAEVQRRLLPEAPPERDAAAVAAVSLPARSIGGDYFDFIDVGDRRLGIALADIAGKGIPAALIMSSVRMALRVLASEPGASLPDLVARMNHVLHEGTPANSYATFFYARMDDDTRELRYINAGHLPPILVRSGELQELTTGGSVIGLLDGLSYEEGNVSLQAGDVLVAFTDGVPEAQNAAEEEFGETRLKALLTQIAHLDAPEIAARLLADLKAWIQDASQYDDLTFIVLKVRDLPGKSERESS